MLQEASQKLQDFWVKEAQNPRDWDWMSLLSFAGTLPLSASCSWSWKAVLLAVLLRLRARWMDDTGGVPFACRNTWPPTSPASGEAAALSRQLKDGSHNINVSKAFEGIRKICHEGKMDLGSSGIDFKVSLY